MSRRLRRALDPRRSRAALAALLGLGWFLSVLPVLLGRARCPMAEILGVPCPGCGMTRAILLLAKGDAAASLRMHPLAVPSALAAGLFMAATVYATAVRGSPVAAWDIRWGRAVILAFVAVEGAVFLLWGARACGLLGGPVAV